MSPSDAIVKAEMSEIERLVALGLGRYEAIQAVEAGLDSRAVESRVTEPGRPVAFTPGLPR
jgi:hypothetical protein